MKILGIQGSPRPSGNTEALVKKALEGARQEGAETELFRLAGKQIGPCDSCNSCHRTGRCRVDDDMQPLYDFMAEADGIIFATPVFFYGMTAQLKAVIDRTYAPTGPGKSMANKVGAVIVVAGSVGVIDVVKDMYFYFAMKRMIHGNWVGAYATVKGDIENLPAGLQSSLDLGREMVQIADLGFQYPGGFRRNHFAYGTHTH